MGPRCFCTYCIRGADGRFRFDRRRAVALSHALNGASAAGVLFAPLWVLLIDKTGFVVAAALVGAVMTATIWPLAGRFLGPTPETKGVAPDGEAPSQRVRNRQPQCQARPLRALFRDRRFATLSARVSHSGSSPKSGSSRTSSSASPRSWGTREPRQRSALLPSVRFPGASSSGACWGAPTVVWRRPAISQCKPAAARFSR